jgi:hypothetical protein
MIEHGEMHLGENKIHFLCPCVTSMPQHFSQAVFQSRLYFFYTLEPAMRVGQSGQFLEMPLGILLSDAKYLAFFFPTFKPIYF